MDNFNFSITNTRSIEVLESLCFGVATNKAARSYITLPFSFTVWNVLFVDQAGHHIDNGSPFLTHSTAVCDFDKNFCRLLHPSVSLHQYLFLLSFASCQQLFPHLLFSAKFSAALLISLSSFTFLLFLFFLQSKETNKLFQMVLNFVVTSTCSTKNRTINEFHSCRWIGDFRETNMIVLY